MAAAVEGDQEGSNEEDARQEGSDEEDKQQEDKRQEGVPQVGSAVTELLAVRGRADAFLNSTCLRPFGKKGALGPACGRLRKPPQGPTPSG